MDLLIIGGTGFFGKAILTFLSNQNNNLNSISIVGRSAKNFEKIYPHYSNIQNIHFHDVDILKNLNDLSGSYTHIIHAAADSTNVTNLTYMDRYNQIVNGTLSVLEFVRYKHPQAKLLFISSGGVYGEMPSNINSFKEDCLTSHNSLDPSNVYSISKRSAENLCAIYSETYSLNICIARCFSFSGIDLPLDVHFAIGNFVKDAVSNKDIYIHGDGLSIRSYLDQNDLAEWILAICYKDKFNLSVYNIGSDESINIKSLADLVTNISNKNINVKVLNKKDRKLNKSVYVPDITKIKNTFNLDIKVSLQDSIKMMIEHHLKLK